MNEATTVFWKSKRFYVTILTAILPLIPPVGVFAASYPELYASAIALVFGWVGLKTTRPISFKKLPNVQV